MNKLLTIVIPTYNTEQYLSRCIESLIVFEYMDVLEIIVVIDGSPDNSLQLANMYKDKYPNTIQVINKSNGGHGSTINKGLELAKGKYFRVLDSDDWFHTENFKVFLAKLSNANDDIVMSHLSKEYIYENRSVLEPTHGIIFDKSYKIDSFDYMCLPINFFGMARCTYKTDLLRNNNLNLLENAFFEDSYLHIFPIIFLKSFVFYDLVIYHYFLGRPGQSVSREVALKHNEHWQRLICQIIEFYETNKLVFTKNSEQFLMKVMGFYVSHQYSQMNNFDYKKSKKEIANWDKFISSLPYSKLVTDYKKTLYNIFPYFVFRSLYYLRTFWMLKIYKNL
tara:strand:- start:8942 stop:9949 length:1008 start_codon:yes stop_codon:yes gene_type:complete